jgi:hypothetical protein
MVPAESTDKVVAPDAGDENVLGDVSVCRMSVGHEKMQIHYLEATCAKGMHCSASGS